MLKKLLLMLLSASLYATEQATSRNYTGVPASESEIQAIEREMNQLLAQKALNSFKARMEFCHCLVESVKTDTTEMHSLGFPLMCRSEALALALYTSQSEVQEITTNFKKAYAK